MNHFSWRATHSCILFTTDLRRSRVIGVSEKQHRGVQCKTRCHEALSLHERKDDDERCCIPFPVPRVV